MKKKLVFIVLLLAMIAGAVKIVHQPRPLLLSDGEPVPCPIKICPPGR